MIQENEMNVGLDLSFLDSPTDNVQIITESALPEPPTIESSSDILDNIESDIKHMEVRPSEKFNEVLKSTIHEKIKGFLKPISNKNSLYRAIKLPLTYLNLKNFLAGRDPKLKEKSLNALNNTLGYTETTVYLPEDVSEEVIQYLKELNEKYLKDVEEFANSFNKNSPQSISQEDIHKQSLSIKETINNLKNTIDFDN